MNKFDETTDDEYKRETINKPKAKRTELKAMLFLLVVAVLSVLAVWIWKGIELNNEREKAEQDRQAMLINTRTLISETHKEHLKVLAKPYVWALRIELLKGNIDEINNYANEMVKEKNIKSVIVANDKGLIISSTNKTLEGKEFTTIGKPEYLFGDSTIVENLSDSIIVMSSPIMGFNNRLGTMMITHRTKPPL